MASSRQTWLNSDTGILRKKEDDDELLVFGYSCKLFRDDEKALFIDQGKHLIPWMGDETLKIDRYDGRGALYDLKQCEAPLGGYDTHRWVGLSEAERRVEQLCDEERYRALHHNEEEEALYQEEELKRLHKALDSNSYGEVAFNYEDNSAERSEEKKDGQAIEEEGGDEPFVPPTELDIPINMTLPDTVKLNAIIEKTALFISQQGAQMEILLKMKQAGNPQFQFLSFDSSLHAYYRHLLMAIKTGRYRPKSERNEKEAEPEDGGDEHYLHPSLAPGNSRVELAPSIPSISYKPSANCSYSMLVNSIKNRQASFGVNPLQQQQPPAPGTSDHILPMHYPAEVVIPMPNDHIIEASPVLYKRDPNSVDTPTAASAALYHQARYLYPAAQQAPVHTSMLQESTQSNVNSSDEEHYSKPMASVYSGDYNESASPASETFILPPPDMQLIIDKMASYVAKNGRDFETIVKSKGDSRFVFLDENHQYHAYYQHKLNVYEKLEAPIAPPSAASPDNTSIKEGNESSQDATLNAEDDSQDGSERSSDGSRNESSKGRNKPAPVCFSIKKPKENEALLLEKRSALPVEESTDEEDTQEGEKEKQKEEKRKEDTVVKNDKELKQEAEVIDLTESSSMPTLSTTCHNGDENVGTREKKSTVDKTKWAEERLKDKLAAAAREKIAAAAREKQLQLERKRRAAAFLNMIRKDHPLGGPELPVMGPQLPDGTPVQRVSGDEDEISSIPSPISINDGHSPLQLDNSQQELEERLSPKANGTQSSQTTSLFARIQESKKCSKKRHASVSSNSSCGSHNSHRLRNSSHSGDKHRTKKKHTSNSHKRMFASPSHSYFRPHKHKKEEERTKHRKTKKKDRSRSRSRSESHHSYKSHRHIEKSSARSHHVSSEVHNTKRSHHKKSKRSSRNLKKRSGSTSSSS